MSLETTLNRFGINFGAKEATEEKIDRFAEDEYHFFVNTPVGWVEKRDDGGTVITKDQLMQLQSNYIGISKPYVAQDLKDGTYLINMRKL